MEHQRVCYGDNVFFPSLFRNDPTWYTMSLCVVPSVLITPKWLERANIYWPPTVDCVITCEKCRRNIKTIQSLTTRSLPQKSYHLRDYLTQRLFYKIRELKREKLIFVASQDQNQDALPPVEIRLTHVTWQYGTKYGHKTGFYTISIGCSDLKDNVTGSWMDLEQISKDNENWSQGKLPWRDGTKWGEIG